MMNSGEDKEVPMVKTVWKKIVGGFRWIIASRGDFSPEAEHIGTPLNPRREFHLTVSECGSTNGLPGTMEKYYRVSK